MPWRAAASANASQVARASPHAWPPRRTCRRSRCSGGQNSSTTFLARRCGRGRRASNAVRSRVSRSRSIARPPPPSLLPPTSSMSASATPRAPARRFALEAGKAGSGDKSLRGPEDGLRGLGVSAAAAGVVVVTVLAGPVGSGARTDVVSAASSGSGSCSVPGAARLVGLLGASGGGISTGRRVGSMGGGMTTRRRVGSFCGGMPTASSVRRALRRRSACLSSGPEPAVDVLSMLRCSSCDSPGATAEKGSACGSTPCRRAAGARLRRRPRSTVVDSRRVGTPGSGAAADVDINDGGPAAAAAAAAAVVASTSARSVSGCMGGLRGRPAPGASSVGTSRTTCTHQTRGTHTNNTVSDDVGRQKPHHLLPATRARARRAGCRRGPARR